MVLDSLKGVAVLKFVRLMWQSTISMGKNFLDTLNTLGLSDLWLSHDTFYSQAAFKNKVKTRISDQFKQAWKSNIDESEKCLNYRL